jgi:hypothetical protein
MFVTCCCPRSRRTVFSLETTRKFWPAVVCAWLACAPSSVDRTLVTDVDGGVGDAASDGPRDAADGPRAGSGGTAGSLGSGGSGGGPAGGSGGGTGGAGGMGGKGGTGGSRDAGPDVAAGGQGGGAPDAAPDLGEGGADGGAARKALLVVGDPKALSKGDQKIKMVLESRGFEVVLGDDNGAATASNGTALVVLCSSSAAATLAAKFKDVTLPVLDLESAVYDDMKMTAGTTGTDFDEENGTMITILPAMQAHPLAGGKMGAVAVSAGGGSGCCGINWGKPAATAIAIASFGTTANPNKVALFGYDTGAKMIDDFPAPARRAGLFAADTTLANLSPDGTLLIVAAISWLLP